MTMTKKQIVLAILERKKIEVGEHRASYEYPEWSCGQQDADAEEAEAYDRVLNRALDVFTDNNMYVTMKPRQITELALFVKEIMEELVSDVDNYITQY